MRSDSLNKDSCELGRVREGKDLLRCSSKALPKSSCCRPHHQPWLNETSLGRYLKILIGICDRRLDRAACASVMTRQHERPVLPDIDPATLAGRYFSPRSFRGLEHCDALHLQWEDKVTRKSLRPSTCSKCTGLRKTGIDPLS